MGKLFIISGPSGAGEDSVIEGLQKRMSLTRVITTTTREMRDGEMQGAPYYFISHEEFQQKIKDDGFFEYAELDRGKLYGVTNEELQRVKESESVGIWKMDYKGVLFLKEKEPSIPAIFIWASLDVLEERIRFRGGVDAAFILERISYAQGWFDNRDIFDFEVENV